MRPRLRRARASCLALVIAGTTTPSALLAQNPIDVPTVVSVPPHDDTPVTTSPPVPPWDAPTAQSPTAQSPTAQSKAQPSEVATAAAPPATPITAFTGAAEPLTCRSADYCLIIDEHSVLRLGTLCRMPGGAWQLLP